MAYEVKLQMLAPRILAAMRLRVAIKDIPVAFKPALDSVWAFLRKNPDLRDGGHNIFLYHHESPAIMPIDFGVEVVRTFSGEGDVACVTTPSGEAAVTVHRGPYSKLFDAHQALQQWCKANNRTIGAHSLEIYGDWCDDPEKLETTIQYLLK
jgi:effector-binding domain-containing protein